MNRIDAMKFLVTSILAIGCLAQLGLAQSTPKKVPDGASTQSPSSDETQGSSEKSADESTGPVAEKDEAFEKFNNILAEIRKNEQQVNSLIISMPTGFAEQRNAHQARINSLRRRNSTIAAELMPAAIESFEKFPGQNEAITNYLLKNLQLLITGKNYRQVPFSPPNALEAYQRLVAGGVDTPVCHMMGYRAQYILNEFENASLALAAAAKAGQQIDARLVDDLKGIYEYWKDEVAARQADSTSEPPRVRIELDCGVVVVELFEDQVPNTVANFVSLVEDQFYDGLIFFQANPTQFAATGSPSNNGKGGPGYAIKSENENENVRRHFTGVLSAVQSSPGQSGSQFLITKQPRPDLDGKLTPFGRVIEGLENIYKIQIVDKTRISSANNPVKPTQIISMTVLRKRDHEYKPEKVAIENTPLPPR